ncbi:post-transcriptional regulator [Priestia filamentosa]|uniref:post-transcriptional regulator n=1 Tax=Priestia filamentosa TaxID=1402861 RepID=UPI001FB35DE3|nr:post-transcriptional regulator [Priestia filamentosa]UOE61304.1 post-transcriptional regulator [Priestia filamentosa]
MGQAVSRTSRRLVEPAMRSKMEEFRLFGYEEVTEEIVWQFLQQKKWKNRKIEELKLYELVNDILGVKISEVMNFMTIEVFKNDRAKKGLEDISDLL